MKTKVESFLSQIPMSSSAQGSSGSFEFIPQSPLGPSGRTRSRQKTIGESVEKREGQGLFPSSLFYFTVVHYCYCVFPFSFSTFFVCFHSFSVLCAYAFCDVLPLTFLFLFAGRDTSSHDWWDSGERSDYSSFCCSPRRGKGAL